MMAVLSSCLFRVWFHNFGRSSNIFDQLEQVSYSICFNKSCYIFKIIRKLVDQWKLFNTVIISHICFWWYIAIIAFTIILELILITWKKETYLDCGQHLYSEEPMITLNVHTFSFPIPEKWWYFALIENWKLWLSWIDSG